MFSNISFIGGIHGVGKSTICKVLSSELNIQYLSASDVLKWLEMNQNVKNKKVHDVSLTQDRLINGLTKRIDKNYHYLLDGHYCLLNKSAEIVKVPFSTFEAINPISLHLIIGDITEIKSRLESRDQNSYNYQLLKDMQDKEIDYANEISQKLNIPLSIGNENDYSAILTALRNL